MRRFVCTVLLLLCCLGGRAASAAASCPSLTASSADGLGGTVSTWTSGKTAHLFLPGCWDAGHIVLDFSGYDSLLIGDLSVTPGQTVALSGLLEQSLTVRDGVSGKALGTLQCHQGSELPAMFITVDAGGYGKLNRDQSLALTEGSVVYREADGSVTYDGALTQLKGRGNATYSSEYKKKPYQLKLAGKVSLSGMGKGKTWILLANATDTSLLRNQVTLELSRAMGLPCTVGCQQTELYVNGEYRGLYLLTEKIQISKSRLNIRSLEDETQALLDAPASSYTRRVKNVSSVLSDMRWYDLPAEPEDITGGYLLVLEKPYRYRKNSTASGFQADGKLCVIIKEPTCASKAQVLYIGGLIADLQKALLSDSGVSSGTGKYYADYLDLPSFAGKFLLEMAVKNFDFRSGSQYLYKDSDLRDGRLYAGPGWDYDLTFGSAATEPEGAYITRKAPNNLWYLLSRHEDFMALARSLYGDTLTPLLRVLLGEEAGEGSGLLSIRAYGEAIRASAGMNYVRWSVTSVARATNGHSGKDFDGGIDRMVSFLRQRVAWMDSYFAE